MRRLGERPAARRARFEKSVGGERWLVSYADFITLLFAFFVVMYSISQVNESKYRSLSETLNSAFTREPSGVGDASNQNNLADLTNIEQALTEQLSGFPIEGQVRMSANESWVELSLSSELLFTSGSAESSSAANQLFSDLAGVLSDIENEVQIIGHTDNVPISNDQFENNWALSSARAVAIVNTLAFQGIDPQRLSATGFGEYRPIADNSTAEGRSQNRRVVVRIGSSAAPEEVLPNSELSAVSNDTSEPVPAESLQNLRAPTVPSESDPASDQNSRPLPNGIQPLRLKGGDLLFTSDPDLPRTREIEE